MSLPLVYPLDFDANLNPQPCPGETAIYCLCAPDGQIRYIGQAVNPPYRIREHHNPRLLCTKTHKNDWIRSLLAHGEWAVLRVLLWVPLPDANVAEIAYIAEARQRGLPLTNATNGGHGATGHVKSEETRRKLSLAHKGKAQSPEQIKRLHEGQRRWLDAGVRSPELREKLGAAARKRWARDGERERFFTPEVRERMSQAKRKWAETHTISPETRAKLSAASKARATPGCMPEACRAASIRAKTGRPLTAEHRAKLSQSQRERQNGRRKSHLPELEQLRLPF